MANLLQLSCPKCSTQLRVPRPAGTTGKAKCGKCSHTFTFRVSQPAAATPAVRPAVAAAPTAPVIPDDPFSALPDLANVPGIPNASLQSQPLQSPAARSAPARTSRQAARSGKRRPIVPIAIVSTSLLVILAIVVGGWTLLGRAKLIPTSMMIFDSGNAVLADADASDLELLRLIKSIEGETIPQETLDQVTEIAVESKQLLIRAFRLSLMTEQEAIELTGVPAQPKDSDNAGFFRKARPSPEGPLDDDAKEMIREIVGEIPSEKRMGLVWGLGQGFGNAEFVREYLRYGHLRTPEPAKRGEQIAAKQIDLIRKASKMGIGYAEKIDVEQIEALQKEGDSPDQEKIRQYVWGLFSPIDDDLSEIGEQLFALAEERHGLGPDEVGDLKQYEEIYRFAFMMTRHVYGGAISTFNGKVTAFAGLENLLAGTQDLDAANRGMLPSRLAEKIRANQPTAEELKLQFEQQKQAMQQQAEELRAKNEKIAAQKRQEEAAKIAAARSKADAANQGPPDSNSIASGNPSPLSPTGANTTNNGNGGRPAMGSPFGPRPSGVPAGMGQGGRFRGPQSGGPRGPGPAGMRGPGGGGAGPSSRPEFDPTTGVTIVMNDARGISTKDVAGKFIKTLKVGSQVNLNNDKLTVRLSYTGPLETVTKLIDFGTVVSANEETRMITLEPK